MTISFDHIRLKKWFAQEKRDLPWRDQPTPYAVWVSEIMLQQTQVSVVVPYFLRWMQRFPTIKDLAEAPLDQVIKEWEGLGYYSRARNLHQAAQYVVEVHGGELPNTYEALEKIKGLGPYTVGAILSFAFHKKVPAVDGNVLRVLARYFMIEDDINKPKTVQTIRQLAMDILPDEEPWIVNEALIELGAVVCQRKAQCLGCPLKKNCAAYVQGATERLPYKSARTKVEFLYRAVAVIHCGEHILVQRGKKGQVMSDLHEFPYFDTDPAGINAQNLTAAIREQFSLDVQFERKMSDVKHTFTRYRVQLFPMVFRAKKRDPVKGFQWLTQAEVERLAFSSGHRRVLSQVMSG